MTGLPPLVEGLRLELETRHYLFAFKDAFGLWQVYPWWVHLGQGYYGRPR